ncbi:protein kinase domain-containing protein [Actinomadura atramentaria]|uniref:protein kinase domain-containing protein n=1 Tax=Actinomadura atramentaria TaxID=1990 RepID=UPI00036283FD|nr:protein kinase [Actinomadura atramentaria]
MDGSPARRPGDPERVGPYRIEARLGEGGMGAVYLGRAADGTAVAVKVVRPDLAGHPAFLARFRDEARNARRVASFCTAQVLDHGTDGPTAYLATEFIEGPSLQQQLDADGPLTAGTLHGVAVGVATALVAIHAAGLVHRDLKPGNVLLSRSGPRVIDFGIARALDEAASLTRTGQLLGTPGFLAPEQVSGGEITPATDVFAWGCLVAVSASGHNPFGTGPVHVMAARALHAEPDLSALAEPLAGLVRAALDKDPARRPTARALLLDLVGADAPGPAAEAAARAVPPTLVAPPEQRRTEPVPEPVPGIVPDTAPIGTGPVATLPPVPEPVPGPDYAPPARRRGRSRALLAGGAAAVAAALTAVAVVVLWPDGKPAAGPAAFPRDPLLVRIDTAPGWPKQCHGDIGRYTPGTAAPVVLVGGPTCDVLPQWSPDRRRIAFTRSLGRTVEAWVANADGSGARLVTDALPGLVRVAWSPDGKRIAYPVRTGGVRQFEVRAVDGGDPARITSDDADKDDPTWSRQGRLAFWSKTGDGVPRVYTMDPDSPGSAFQQVTRDDVPAGDPAWSPDGKSLAYTRGKSPHGQIWVTTASGGNPHRVTTGDVNESDPWWSPDGRWLVYVRGPFTDPVVHAIRPDGTGDRVLTPAGTVIAHPNW